MENDFLITVKTKAGLCAFWQKEIYFMETCFFDENKTRIKLKRYTTDIYSTETMDDIMSRIKTLITIN